MSKPLALFVAVALLFVFCACSSGGSAEKPVTLNQTQKKIAESIENKKSVWFTRSIKYQGSNQKWQCRNLKIYNYNGTHYLCATYYSDKNKRSGDGGFIVSTNVSYDYFYSLDGGISALSVSEGDSIKLRGSSQGGVSFSENESSSSVKEKITKLASYYK